ncbi:trehalose 6-phosphatase [Solimonas aquatica]|uniref:Trehalose 6-phosphate phosphatase n=1 Tax=Solimonas aquatica TaxID=489703 RepID=A0A1H9KEK3_9GAMM|nr:trehalose-phosphatase [Solimonas aquatica]SEQ97508.1 trehalose 6-phosphatase [Solimonas aquatica]
MIPILSPGGRAALAEFLRPNTLLAFDYDGTLAPIVDDPAQAQLRPRTQRLLQALARRRPTAVLSGRARADVLRLLAGIPLLEVVGNHGAEAYGLPPRLVTLRVEQWRQQLQARLQEFPGVQIEDKRLSLSLHYRHCDDAAAVEQQLRSLCRELPGVRLLGGKSVLNLLPVDAPCKGQGLRQVLERLGCPRAVFVGDDETDESVFRWRDPQRLLGVRVGRCERTAAEYLLESQADIDELLELLRAPLR